MIKEKLKGGDRSAPLSLIQKESGDKMMLQKKKSGFILLEAVLAILLMSMASYGLAMTSALQFNQLEAKHTANEAEQYALNEVKYLREVGYYDLDEALHDRKSNFEFSGVDGWESVTSFVTEKVIDDDTSIKIAKVEVYKEGENIPRYSMEVPLTSQGSNSNIKSPDWTNAETISLPYTATENGFIWGGYLFYGWGSNGQYPNIHINGKSFFAGYESTHANGGAVFFSVQQGDTVTISDYQQYYFYFIPCK